MSNSVRQLHRVLEKTNTLVFGTKLFILELISIEASKIYNLTSKIVMQIPIRIRAFRRFIISKLTDEHSDFEYVTVILYF